MLCFFTSLILDNNKFGIVEVNWQHMALDKLKHILRSAVGGSDAIRASKKMASCRNSGAYCTRSPSDIAQQLFELNAKLS